MFQAIQSVQGTHSWAKEIGYSELFLCFFTPRNWIYVTFLVWIIQYLWETGTWECYKSSMIYEILLCLYMIFLYVMTMWIVWNTHWMHKGVSLNGTSDEFGQSVSKGVVELGHHTISHWGCPGRWHFSDFNIQFHIYINILWVSVYVQEPLRSMNDQVWMVQCLI